MRPVTNDTVMHLLSQRHGAGLLRLIGIERRGVLQATYQVHLLRNHDPDPLLADPVTAVFAPLARVPPGQRPAVLRQALEIITASDHPDRDSLIQAAGALASLRITDRTIIDTTIKEAAMPIDLSQTPYYREVKAHSRLLGMLELRFGAAGAEVSEQVLGHLGRQADPVRLIAEAASLDDLVRDLGA